jgi:hypothetical protein
MKKFIAILFITFAFASSAYPWVWDISDESIQPEMLEGAGTIPSSSKFYRGDGTWQTVTALPGGIEDNSITNTLINSAAGIVGSKLADNTITGAKIQDSAIDLTGTKVTGSLPVAKGGTGSDNAAGARTNLSLGTISTQASDNISITGGSITGITDLAVADGGTGASTASGARSNLGADNASNLATGLVSKGVGGFGTDVSDQTGVPLFTSGLISWETVTEFLAIVGITFNSADNTWVFVAPATVTGNLTVTGEITAAQVNTTCSYTDNTCGVNAANAGAPSAPSAGDCYYDNTAKYDSCWSGTAWSVPALLNSSSRTTKGVDTTDDLIVDLATKGLVLKDTQGTPHYWRVTIDNTGVLTTADVGTGKP